MPGATARACALEYQRILRNSGGMSDPDSIRVAAQPENAEQAAPMIAPHKAGAWGLVIGAVLGLPSAHGCILWPIHHSNSTDPFPLASNHPSDDRHAGVVRQQAQPTSSWHTAVLLWPDSDPP